MFWLSCGIFSSFIELCLTNSSGPSATFSLGWEYACAVFCSCAHALQLSCELEPLVSCTLCPFFDLIDREHPKLPFTCEWSEGWRGSGTQIPNLQMQFALAVVGESKDNLRERMLCVLLQWPWEGAECTGGETSAEGQDLFLWTCKRAFAWNFVCACFWENWK